MPSVIDTLPLEIKGEFEKRLIEGGFADYRGLVGWLAEQGVTVSLSQVGRHGATLKERFQRVRDSALQARAFVDAVGGATADMTEATHALLVESIFDVINRMEDPSDKIPELARLAQAIARLTSSGVSLSKYRDSVRTKAAEAAESVTKKLKQSGGLSQGVIDQVRAQILGIGSDE